MKSILLLGGGGHCKSVLDSLKAKYDRIGLVVNELSETHSVPVVGSDEDLRRLYDEGWNAAFICVGSVGNTTVRERVFDALREIGFELPCVIDDSAIIADDVKIADGCFIGKRAVVNAGSYIDTCAIINSGAIVEHDCKVGKFCHIAPGAVLCGNVSIGAYTHIGAGSAIKQGVRIGDRSVIGLGSAVTHDFGDGVTAFGNPAKERMPS